MPLKPLCPDPVTWRITVIAPERDRLVLHLEPLRRAVACPVCGTQSQRVHSRYRRKPWDLPWGGWPVQLVVHARRFFCDTLTCSRRIFVEPFPRVLARFARQTERWRQVLLELAHSSNAEMAARVALGHTILVIVHTLLTRKQPYQDLGAAYFDSLVQQRVERRLVQRLERLGYQVSLQPSNL